MLYITLNSLHIRVREQILADGLLTTTADQYNNSNEHNLRGGDSITATDLKANYANSKNNSNINVNNSSSSGHNYHSLSPTISSSSNSNSSMKLNWCKDTGTELTPMQWHKQLSNPPPNGILLDCRNSYESNVGVFQGAVPLNTTFFRESWAVLDDILKDTPKDTPIYTYCTGGIRCVKVNAYLHQRMGFHNTHRLSGGIVSYTRELAAAEAETGLHIYI